MVNVPSGSSALTAPRGSRMGARAFDIPGQLLFIAAVGAFVFAVIEGLHRLALGVILTLFVVAGAALAAFIFCEGRSGPDDGPEALPRPHVLARDHRNLRRVFCLYGMVLVITQYLQNVHGFSPTDAGLVLLSYSVSMMALSLTAGKLVEWWARAG